MFKDKRLLKNIICLITMPTRADKVSCVCECDTTGAAKGACAAVYRVRFQTKNVPDVGTGVVQKKTKVQIAASVDAEK